jgi:CspA family cold shock protein
MELTSDNVTNSPEIQLGRVKWFNNKTGFGFITVTDGTNEGNDIFVHHSSIKVDTEQYKYLVQGEYVEFELVTTNGGKHKFQAGSVMGIKGGKLMCETRKEFRVARNIYKCDNLDVKGTSLNNSDNNGEWKEVVKRSTAEVKRQNPEVKRQNPELKRQNLEVKRQNPEVQKKKNQKKE